jgi:hypothetical protein
MYPALCAPATPAIAIQGGPGIGKSALAAQLVKVNDYIHHFNDLAAGCNSPEAFLANVCAQLIVAYDLPYRSLPAAAAHDAGFLTRLLGEATASLPGQPVVIVVDALDEVDQATTPAGGNPLFLPKTLPAGVYFILTTQPTTVPLRTYCEYETFPLREDRPENISDAREYVREMLDADEHAQAALSGRQMSEEQFIDGLVEKSEGNFAYLHYVLQDLKGHSYEDLALSDLPKGHCP